MIPVVLLFLVAACSTQKNTGITRAYHNLTSRYNILFNGEESFKKGMLSLEKNYDYNFNELLPVFLYTDADQLSSIAPEMDRSIKKATKLIAMHSLTVKPEYDTEKGLSPKQKEFLSRKEYNNYVDDAYLLMGKAHFYKMEYPRARETFNYVVTNFGEDYTVYESKMWLARLAIEEDRTREAQDLLASLERNIDFPKQILGELYATLADFHIHQQNYDEAVSYLNLAVENTTRKDPRMRYHYLLAQLYSETDQGYLASESYKKVIRMNPPYRMAFSAKIHRALSYQGGAGQSREIEKELNKMLRDDKNIEFQDQIYYALGDLYFKQNKTAQAIEYYKMSLQASTDNLRQKARTNLTLADLFYAKPDYINAQAYYDSAVTILDPEYPNYDLLFTKSVSLTNLVDQINTAEFQDSVLTLSYKPRSEIDALIADLIEQERQAEEAQRLAQVERAQEMNETRNQMQSLAQSGSNFYFYNNTVKTVGRKNFIEVWGNRKLEDNWRRRNKSSVSFAAIEESAEAESEAEETVAPGEVVTNRKTPEFYLQYIPFTDSAREASNKMIANALYRMGEIYREELRDYPKAIESYEELLKRFPTYENRLSVYYSLFTIANEQEDKERVSKYQQKIINEFPESNYAKLMTNPNYVDEVLAQERKVYEDYRRAYGYFNNGNFSQAMRMSQQLMQTYPDHSIFPQFDYMYTVSAGIQKDTLGFIRDLSAFESRYPNTDLAGNARILIDFLENERPDVVVQQNIEMARELYRFNPDEKHYFVFLAPRNINAQQLHFNILDFNTEYYDDQKLRFARRDLNSSQIVMTVMEFGNAEKAEEYKRRIAVDEITFNDINPQGIRPMIISASNYNAMLGAKSAEQYQLFYNENY